MKTYIASFAFVISFAPTVYANTVNLTATLDSSQSTANYGVTSSSPSGAGSSGNTSVSGSVSFDMVYTPLPPPYAGVLCPNPTSVTLTSGSISGGNADATINWGGTTGSYTYSISSPVASITSTSLVNNGGTLVESGTGTLGSQLSRTTNFSVNNKTYSIGGYVTNMGRTGGLCKYDVTLNSYPSANLWTTTNGDPTNISVTVGVTLKGSAYGNL